MFYKYLFLFFLLVVHLFGNTIVGNKMINGNLYKIIESNAEVMPSFDANGKSLDGVSLVFKNTQGQVAISKKIYTNIPEYKNNHIKIYYIEKEKEIKKIYEISFHKNDIHLLADGVIRDKYHYNVPDDSLWSTIEPIIVLIMFISFFILLGLIIFSGVPNAGEVDGTYKSD